MTIQLEVEYLPDLIIYHQPTSILQALQQYTCIVQVAYQSSYMLLKVKYTRIYVTSYTCIYTFITVICTDSSTSQLHTTWCVVDVFRPLALGCVNHTSTWYVTYIQAMLIGIQDSSPAN